MENLAYACFECNRFKGPNLSSRDPITGEVTPLYNPREQRWAEHFRWQDAIIEPLSAAGRATAFLLRFNLEDRTRFRANLLSQDIALGPP